MGLVDVTDCYYGFPISLSFPHFMDGDKHLQTDITGLEPNKEKHSSEFIIQPVSWEQALEKKRFTEFTHHITIDGIPGRMPEAANSQC